MKISHPSVTDPRESLSPPGFRKNRHWVGQFSTGSGYFWLGYLIGLLHRSKKGHQTHRKHAMMSWYLFLLPLLCLRSWYTTVSCASWSLSEGSPSCAPAVDLSLYMSSFDSSDCNARLMESSNCPAISRISPYVSVDIKNLVSVTVTVSSKNKVTTLSFPSAIHPHIPWTHSSSWDLGKSKCCHHLVQFQQESPRGLWIGDQDFAEIRYGWLSTD